MHFTVTYTTKPTTKPSTGVVSAPARTDVGNMVAEQYGTKEQALDRLCTLLSSGSAFDPLIENAEGAVVAGPAEITRYCRESKYEMDNRS